MIQNNPAAERAVLSGICRYGSEAYFDVCDIIRESTFTIDSNQIIYKCQKHILDADNNASIDLPSIYSAANTLGLAYVFDKKNEAAHLQAIFDFPIDIKNVRKFAGVIGRLEVARLLDNQLTLAKSNLSEISGEEPVAQILGIAEDSIFNFSSLINDEQKHSRLGEGIEDLVEHLITNPVDQIGISTGYKEFDKAIGGGLRPGISMVGARPKCLSIKHNLYTPNGSKNICDIQIGDLVATPTGYSYVVNTLPVSNDEIYRVYFRDGDYIDCTKDHLWQVYKRFDKKHKPVVKETQELINDLKLSKQKYKWDIVLPKATEFNQQELPVDPYVLGLLIGDGSFRNAINFYCHQDDIELLEHIRNRIGDFEIKTEPSVKGSKCLIFRINSFQDTIRKTGLYKKTAYDKFIPNNYKYSTIQDRIEILRGLLDTDGCCHIEKRSCRVKYVTVSLKLAQDIKEIVHSLGGLTKINIGHSICEGKRFKHYSLEIRIPNINPFRLKRKADKFFHRQLGDLKRTIIKIEKIGTGEVKCITIENNDGMFLTDNFIPTHNCGKTTLARNIGMYIASKEQIPVFNLDTEMVKEDHQIRAISMLSEVPINIIETGKFSLDQVSLTKVRKAAKEVSKGNYHFASISGMAFEEQLGLMRRWISKEVGLKLDGTAKPCVVIYDYLKLMTSESIRNNVAEHQAIGFMMTGLHNFGLRYKIPILGFVQLNRDGITKEGTESAAQSDRIIWLCQNFSIFKKKSDEEIAVDGPEAGNRKLVPLIARYGEGLSDGDYINFNMKGWLSQISEGKLHSELQNNQNHNPLVTDTGFQSEALNGNDDDELPFD